MKIFSENELNDVDRKKIYQLDLICFGQKELSDEPLYYFAPTFKHILLFEDEKLVSYLRIVLRESHWHNKHILIGGIGSVETDPGYQRKGYATLILIQSMKILTKLEVDFCLLQSNTELSKKLYLRVGFISANVPYEVLDINNNKRTIPKNKVMIVPIKNPVLVNEIIHSRDILFVGKGDW